METFATELASYGPLTLMAGFVLFLLRGQIIDILKGSSSDAQKVTRALDDNTRAVEAFAKSMDHMGEQFASNNAMFTAISRTSLEMVAELRGIKDEIIRNKVS